ncbi:hypothetical protein KC614_00710 [candidate division WWE3 bacterium]|uniref:Uncharacterized protein n=1 Tax=candidate division WWE3 bacterium TaxID=2053526 RepID=A0A955LJM6_UNCKA|nr:hypothetical protein [candidate division WWE3 bacterium]
MCSEASGTPICFSDYQDNATTGSAASTPATISGVAFVDINDDCIYNGTDFLAPDPTASTLTRTSPVLCMPWSNGPVSGASYSFNNLSCFDGITGEGTYSLNVLVNSDYIVTSACGGNDTSSYTKNGIVVTSGDNVTANTPLSPAPNAWVQGMGTDVYIAGNIQLDIPSSAVNNYFINHATSIDPGVVITGGTIDLGTGGAAYSKFDWNAQGYIMAESALTYQYFVDNLVTTGKIDQTLTVDSMDGLFPTSVSDLNNWYTDDLIAYKITPASGTLTINKALLSTNANVPGKMIVIVDGDVVINTEIALDSELISGYGTLNEGFLLVIATADIKVNDTIGTSDFTDESPNIEGAFLAGGDFIVENNPASPLRLNIAGSVVTGLSTTGSYQSARSHPDNETYPADYLSFNPQLILNVPTQISTPLYTWKEVR